MHEIDLVTPRDVITLRDYVACPTIKSNKETDTVVVVKSDGNLHSIQTGSNHNDNNHYKSVENCAVGVLLL